ncbi:hypothetical protein SLS60_000149 [Paraconiothyrium brasiliense]|uniref:Rhodopsin domain-containing protein n=1 Tax=Paraconiothyrium brasiliense TaxID=300254 RepID=A0ABR3S5H0_9PLEO
MFGLNERGQRTFNTSISSVIIATVAVLLRCYCKYVSKNGFHFDDLFILLALSFLYAAEAFLMWGSITGGGGKEMKDILTSGSKETFKQVSNYLEGLLLAWTFYLVTSFFIRMSLLALYRRIFSTPGYRLIALLIMVISTMWIVGAMIGNFVICIPFDSFWDRLKPGKCLNFNIYALSVGIVEVILDAFTLALPIRVVLSLHVPTHKKIGLMGIFLLGLFAVATGVARVKLMYQPNSIYVRFNESGIWSGVHLMVSIICSCLPVYKPLWQAMSRFSNRLRTLYNSRFNSSTGLPSFVRRKKSTTDEQKSRPRKPFISLKGVPVSSFGSLGGTKGGTQQVEQISVVSTIPEERHGRFDV